MYHYKKLIALCLCLPVVCRAQTDKFNFGLSAPLYVQYNTIDGENRFQRLFGAFGIDALLKVNGTEENSMSFIMAVGEFADVRPFRLDVSSKLTTDLLFLNINPMVSIPSKWPRIRYNLGFGLLVRLGEEVDFSSENSQYPGYYATNLDTVSKILDSKSRGIIPFISAGVSADMGTHFQFQLSIQPTLFDFYEPDTHINYVTSFSNHNFIMAYQPIYLGVRLYYFIRPNR